MTQDICLPRAHVARSGGGRRAEVATNGSALIHHFCHNCGRWCWDDFIWKVLEQLLVVAGCGLHAGLGAEGSRGAGNLAVWLRAEKSWPTSHVLSETTLCCLSARVSSKQAQSFLKQLRAVQKVYLYSSQERDIQVLSSTEESFSGMLDLIAIIVAACLCCLSMK